MPDQRELAPLRRSADDLLIVAMDRFTLPDVGLTFSLAIDDQGRLWQAEDSRGDYWGLITREFMDFEAEFLEAYRQFSAGQARRGRAA
jgi:hypothetical protein